MSGDAALEYHRLTRIGAPRDRQRLVEFQPMDPTNRPSPFTVVENGEVERFDAGAIDAPGSIERLLFYAAGVTRFATAGDGSKRYTRAPMSAGNLHPVDVYVVGGGFGTALFDPLAFGLIRLRPPDSVAGPAALVLTGIPWRTGWKYGERGYRHLYWDAGTMLANLLAVAEDDGVPARVLTGFADPAVADVLGIDGVDEFPLAVVALGDDPVFPRHGTLGPLGVRRARRSVSPVQFPVVTATQRAGELADDAAVAQWRAVAGGEAKETPTWRVPRSDSQSVTSVILQRGSTRIFRRDVVAARVLHDAMTAAGAAIPGDASGVLLHDLTVHAVDGVESGAYTWSDSLRMLRPGDFRRDAQDLILGQPLGGDAAFTVFHGCDLDDVTRRLGARGYRVANLQAGIASGRMALAAFGHGVGATGLTFLDDQTRDYFATGTSPLLVTAIGVPDYVNKAGGRPGHLAELSGYDRLMTRFSRQLEAAAADGEDE